MSLPGRECDTYGDLHFVLPGPVGSSYHRNLECRRTTVGEDSLRRVGARKGARKRGT